MEHWWNFDKGKSSDKNLSRCHFAHHKSQCTDLGSNLGLRSQRPATDHLNHDKAQPFKEELELYSDIQFVPHSKHLLPAL